MDEAEVVALLQACSNLHRWGTDDQRGTLNHITADARVRAARLVTQGRQVGLGHALHAMPPPAPVSRVMLDVADRADITCMDAFTIACHGYEITHLDAIGHMFIEDQMYNGRQVSDEVTESGLEFSDIAALSPGVFTRGVLLDIAALHGVPWLDPGYGVTPEDLTAAEAATGVRVGRGDAIFVHVGADRLAEEGGTPVDVRAGLTAACLPWIFEREIAVYSGDCTEQHPSGYGRVPYPLHQIGFAAMGLVLLDNPNLAELIATCRELNRFSFAVTFAPLALVGATGSPVSPIALF